MRTRERWQLGFPQKFYKKIKLISLKTILQSMVVVILQPFVVVLNVVEVFNPFDKLCRYFVRIRGYGAR